MTPVALKTALQSYAAARGLVTPALEPLVAQELAAIRETIAEAFDVAPGKSKPTTRRRVRWDSKGLADWVAVLNAHVARFEERVEVLLRASRDVDVAVEALGGVAYDRRAFADAVEKVQKVVDELSMAGYADLASWVGKVNEKMGAVLGRRLEEALGAWCETFVPSDSDAAEKGSKKKGRKKVRVPKISVEILLRNQEISASPAVPTARSIFLDELHEYMGIVHWTPRANRISWSGPGSPRVTSVIIAGASRGNATREHSGHRIDRSLSDSTVGAPQRPQNRCVLAHSTIWTARPAASHSGSSDRPWKARRSSAAP